MRVYERGSLLIGLIAIIFTLGSIYPERVRPFFGLISYLAFLIILYMLLSNHMILLVSNYTGLVEASVKPQNQELRSDINDDIAFRIFQKYYPEIQKTYKREYLLFLYILLVTTILLLFIVHNPYKIESLKDYSIMGGIIFVVVVWMITSFAFLQKTKTKFNVRISPETHLDINDKEYKKFSVYLNNEDQIPVYVNISISFPSDLEVRDKRKKNILPNTYLARVTVDSYPNKNNGVLKFWLKYNGSEPRKDGKIKVEVFAWNNERIIGESPMIYEIPIYMYKQ